MIEKSLKSLKALIPLVVSALVLSGCNAALMDPSGPVGKEQKSLILSSFWIMQIVVIPVIIMTLVFAWRYRRNNRKATYSPNWAHSNRIEAVVWAVPAVIILFLGIITWQTSHSLDPHKPLGNKGEAMEIQAISLDWKWMFIYPEQGIATVNELYFPVDRPVHFNVTSETVMNSFFIPRLGSQIYAMAGMDNDLFLEADKQGVYIGKSAHYSGKGFSQMSFKTHVTSQEEFDNWVNKVRQTDRELAYTGSYQDVAKPSVNTPVEYFHPVESGLYERVITSFQSGHGQPENGQQPTGAEAAE
ncbi:ubiquinol oxidase subunit II [Kushneria phosphatilytica]|uniref:Ubiquinol oxidase subunit 2 n=1 Tax=Kushneria phosphatilytica TaxID=657387 RepID=A0A1S1NRD3_9GAMM|nr:ubiquinol oxidase subunit II [Kushneria phosphatilytica]OHV11556.1 ubiquinol oxidase subunit II [Kushneria phosphatilytica]QEL12165.1 ubiquinol oxidase subunit II [Kushneria phosphatilytica]